MAKKNAAPGLPKPEAAFILFLERKSIKKNFNLETKAADIPKIFAR